MTYVYRFSQKTTDGQADMRTVLGGKGAGLAEMCRLGVPVPPGFTISTQACIDYLGNDNTLSDALKREVEQNLAWLETELGKSLTGSGSPLLLSIRSGARVSMPGMMDTILNLGLNDEAVERLAKQSGDPRFAYDSYRRFIQMYGNVVLGLDHSVFELRLEDIREREKVKVDSAIPVEALKELVDQYKAYVAEETGEPFPTDPKEQLWGAIMAVFDSWNNPRARFYRKIHEYDDSWGTGVTVQSMVFGNMGKNSGTGVCFSRNPSTGTQGPYGEFLINAQGEDVVAGIRTPDKIENPDDPNSMSRRLPGLFGQLKETLEKLERHFGDMQDTEFTFEEGKLFLLQTRAGKRTSQASLCIAIDMCREGIIDEKEAILKIDPKSMVQLLASEFDQKAKQKILDEGRLLATGLNAGPGAATGKVALTADIAVAWASEGVSVILARAETSPEDIEGMHASEGVLTQRGGMTSHAAVVARGMGKPCVVGCAEMKVDTKNGRLQFGEKTVKEGDYLSIDGTTGEVILGEIPTEDSVLIRQLNAGTNDPGDQGFQFKLLREWIAKVSKMAVRANADTPQDAAVARLLGAEGIGLCRTEHMFFGEERILHVRRMIVADDEKARDQALAKLLPYQESDFFQLFKAMKGCPVTIRLLDPPLHEFLPHTDELIRELAEAMDMSEKAVKARVVELHELNPMLGHRGCRLGISHPSIYQMQVRAIVGAVQKARAEGIEVLPEIMVPLIATQKELDTVKEFIGPIIAEAGLSIPIGTMIEIPRAALTADEIAQSADFFSFGTNDLTQCGMGLSRDDSAGFLDLYMERNIFSHDPFKTIDKKGIGKLVKMAAGAGRETKPNLKLGVCGEHGGDPASIAFFYSAGLNYVSCSPFRVPVALLAAARASIEAI